MLEHRSLGDSELRRNILHARGTVSALGKMPDRYLDNLCALGFRSWSRLGIPPQLCWFCKTTGNSLQNRPPFELLLTLGQCKVYSTLNHISMAFRPAFR